MTQNLQPKLRSKFRIFLGKQFYTFQRYLEWYFSKKKYARYFKNEALLPCVCFTHKTPLIRKLKIENMQLQYNKVTNLKVAVPKLNRVVIQPGETLSYWKLIGRLSYSKGYVDGMVLHYGTVTEGVGGGLCQLSNLIYWMTLHSPLTVTERHRHSFDVFPDVNRTQPFGSGATCVYNYRDLQIFNDTDQKFQLHVYLDDDYLYGEWRCEKENLETYKVYEKEHKISHETWGGYVRHNLIFRRVFDLDGGEVDDHFITENHAIMMYPPFLEK